MRRTHRLRKAAEHRKGVNPLAELLIGLVIGYALGMIVDTLIWIYFLKKHR